MQKVVEIPGLNNTYHKACKNLRVTKSNLEKFGKMDPNDLVAIVKLLQKSSWVKWYTLDSVCRKEVFRTPKRLVTDAIFSH